MGTSLNNQDTIAYSLNYIEEVCKTTPEMRTPPLITIQGLLTYLVVVHLMIVLAHSSRFGFSHWPCPPIHCPAGLLESTAGPGSECGIGTGAGK